MATHSDQPIFEALEPRILLSSYYIATTGSDSNAGTVEAPYATLAKFFDMAEAGDTCDIRGGTYGGSGWLQVDPTVSGTTDDWITVRSYQEEEVTIDGGGTSSSFMFLRRDNAYLRFQDLSITGFGRGINIYGGSGYVAGHHIDLEYLDISYTGDYGIAGEDGKGIRLADGTHDINIRESNFHHNAGPGVAMIGDVWNVLIEDTDSHDNDDGRGTDGDADGFNVTWNEDGYAHNITFRRVRAWNVTEDGIDVKGDLITYDGCTVWNVGANAFKAWSVASHSTQGRFTVRNSLGFDAGEVIFEAFNRPDLDIADSVFVSTDGGEHSFLYKPSSASITWQGKLTVRNSTFLHYSDGYSNVDVDKQNMETLDLDYNTYHDVNEPDRAFLMREGGTSTYYSNTDIADGTFFAAEGLEEHCSSQLVNVSPFVLSITGSQGVNAGEQASFSALALDPDKGDMTYTWSFGDGSNPVVGNNVTHVYAQGGTYSVTVTVTDDDGGEGNLTQQFTVYDGTTVAVDDSYSVNEDETLIVAAPGILSNDTDVDGDTLTAAVVDNPGNGTLVLNADGSFRYTPNAGYNGTDSFSYTVSDNNGGADSSTVSINVVSVNDIPLAGDDSVLSGVNAPITIDVLHNDTDVEDGDTLTVSDFTQAAHGTVVDNGDGMLTYTPDAGFTGADSFTYTVDDGHGGADTATVTLTITTSPAFQENAGIVVMETEHFTVNAPGNGVASVWTASTDFADYSGDGAMEATPNTGVHMGGATDGPRLDYMIDFATVGAYRIWIRMLGRTGDDDSVHVGFDGAKVEGTGGDGIANSEGYWDWSRSSMSVLVNVASAGVHTFNVWMREDGTVVDKIVLTTDLNFTPSGQGPEESERSNSRNPPSDNNTPTVVASIADVTVNEDVVDTGVDLSGVFDDIEDGSALTLWVAENTNWGLVATNLVGANLTLSYAAQQSGTASITVRATDFFGVWVEDTFSVTVVPVNDPPTATDDMFTVSENSVGNALDVMVNDTIAPDADETLTIIAVSAGSSGGTINIVPGGTAITYSPDAGFAGADSFTYTIDDGHGGADTATVTLTITTSPAFQESGGTVVMETEHFTVNAPGNGVANIWTVSTDFASSGTSMEATPNIGVRLYETTDSPHLDYMIDFTTTGTYRIWVRMLGRSGLDDSIHVGLDGIEACGSDGMANDEGFWDWERGPTMEVSFTGLHTFNVWMREDGTVVDKIVLTTDLNFTPSGQGPEESERKGITHYIFYNNSVWDENDPLPNTFDDAAIAANKSALLPGNTATFANYTNYSRGINGIMVDIDGPSGTPELADFGFKAGTDPNPNNWSAAPIPSVTVRPGAGVGGSDRVTIIWTDSPIKDQWLEVIVKAGGNIGLPEDYVFYFGNLVGDTDGDGLIGSDDYDRFVGQFGQSGSDLAADFNCDARTSIIDLAILRATYGNSLSMLTVPDSPPPAAPQVSTSLVPVAPAPTVSPSAVPIVRGSLDDDFSDRFPIAPAASWPAVELLVEPQSNCASLSQPTQVGSVAATLYRAATSEEDLRTSGGNLPSGNTIHDLLPDVLTECIGLPSYHSYTPQL